MKIKEKIIFFVIILLSFIIFGSDSDAKFQSLTYPKKVTIPRDIIKHENKLNFKINYIYLGEDLFTTEINVYRVLSYSFDVIFDLKAIIYYLNSKGKTLYVLKIPDPRTKYNLLHFDDQRSTGGQHFPNVFYKNVNEVFKFNFIFPYRVKNTHLYELIKSKKLSKIIVDIKMLKVSWKFSYDVPIRKEEITGKVIYREHVKKGEFSFPVNKRIKIKIDYER